MSDRRKSGQKGKVEKHRVFLESAGQQNSCNHLNAQSPQPADTVDLMHVTSLGLALKESACSCCNAILFKWSQKHDAQASECALQKNSTVKNEKPGTYAITATIYFTIMRC